MLKVHLLLVKKNKKESSYIFNFVIELHIDDTFVLESLCQTLGIGSVYSRGKRNSVFFSVAKLSEIAVIIAIFSKYNLNSTKYLDFLDFSLSYFIYTKRALSASTIEWTSKLDSILLNMNKGRTCFDLSKPVYGVVHTIQITANWLLGFVEGDGSFHYRSSNKILVFDICQKATGGELLLLESIKTFLENLAPAGFEDSVKIYTGRGSSNLRVAQHAFILHVIIPLFSSLTFRTKKFLDFTDWVIIFNIFNKGFHYLPEGIQLVDRLNSQMNNRRLSTSKTEQEDREILMKEANELLSLPSNYEVRDNKIWIISELRKSIKEISLNL